MVWTSIVAATTELESPLPSPCGSPEAAGVALSAFLLALGRAHSGKTPVRRPPTLTAGEEEARRPPPAEATGILSALRPVEAVVASIVDVDIP